MDKFIETFRDLLEDTDPNSISASTSYKELDEWSSITALSLIAMIDENYDVTLETDDIRNARTLQELYNVIEVKRK